MLKSKFKIVCIAILIMSCLCFTSFSYAVQEEDLRTIPGVTSGLIEPREQENNDVMPISETEEVNPISETNEIDPISEFPEDKNDAAEEVAYESDLFLWENTITVNQAIDGNVYLIGSDVTINNTVDGNVFIVANKVTISSNSYIYGSTYIVANQIDMNGVVYDLYTTSNTLNLNSEGFIVRDLKSVSKTINFNSKVRRDVYLTVDQLTMNENSDLLVYGDFNYSSGSSIAIPENAVHGKITYHHELKYIPTTQDAIRSYLSSFIFAILYAFVFILILVFSTPKYTKKTTSMISKKILPCLGVGCLTLIGVPIACFLLLITVIGSPISIALFTIYMLAISFSLPILGLSIGSFIANKVKPDHKMTIILFSLLVVAVLWFLKQLPIIDNFVGFIIIILGLGVLLYSLFNKENLSTENSTVESEVVEIIEPKSNDDKTE